MHTLIIIYLLINAFMVGQVTSIVDWSDKDLKPANVTYVILCALFGAVVILVHYLYTFGIWLLTIIDNNTQIQFFLRYLFTKFYHNVPIKDLKILNIRVADVNDKSSWEERLFKKCVELINKRNNYKHEKPFPGSLEEEWAMSDR